MQPNRYALLVGALAVITVAFTTSAPLAAQQQKWVTTWAASPARYVTNAPAISVKALLTPPPEQTIRNIVHVSLGGEKIRVRISNALSAEPLIVPSAYVALRTNDDAIDSATSRALTFSGNSSITIPPGADALSDPVALHMPAKSDLAVSLFTRGRTGTGTLHPLALQTSYAVAGDQAASASLNAPEKIPSWPFLSEVEVAAPENSSAVIAFGDSITDGALSKTDTNLRWPDDLFTRLTDAHLVIGVGNAGIAGNRLLHDGEGGFGPAFGPSALSRFDRDVLALAGVRYMIVLLGINDIGQPGTNGVSADSAVSAEAIEGALRQLVERAHVHGIRVMGATLLPFANTKSPDYFSEEKEKKREAVNQWILSSGIFDAVADFDAATRDPEHPHQFREEFNGGDSLHPSAAGLQAMADSIPLDFFRK
jgi:lysophospholipase L1-like esterase